MTNEPYQAILWKSCDTLVKRAIFRAGFVLAGNADYDRATVALGNACPSGYREVPLDGIYLLAIELVQAQGGPIVLDNILPAENLLERVFVKRWPSCSFTRQRLGFPKIVETSDGKFDWEVPCGRCGSDIANR